MNDKYYNLQIVHSTQELTE